MQNGYDDIAEGRQNFLLLIRSFIRIGNIGISRSWSSVKKLKKYKKPKEKKVFFFKANKIKYLFSSTFS